MAEAPLMTRSNVVSNGARVALFSTGSGEAPLLLIHSVNAAASAAEVEPLRARFGVERQVFCMDLPGFGESDRSDRPYTVRLMTDAIATVAQQIVESTGKPIDALAVSLSCEFLARAASENPHLFRSIALVSPTGFSGTRTLRAPEGATRGKPWLYSLLRGPGWGAALFHQLTRPSVIRYFLERTWGSKNIDEDLWRADIQMSRYPGAHFAPLYFLSVLLFSADIHTVYDSIRLPVWVTHGNRGDFVDYRQLPGFAHRQGWSVATFDTGAMIYFEEPIRFAEQYKSFLDRAGTP